MSADRDEHIKTLTEIAEGCEAAAAAEQLVIDGFQSDVDRFLADERDPMILRHLRIYNDAKSNRRWAAKQALAARYALSVIAATPNQTGEVERT